MIESTFLKLHMSHSTPEVIKTARDVHQREHFFAVILDNYIGTNFVMLFLSPNFCFLCVRTLLSILQPRLENLFHVCSEMNGGLVLEILR